jgi:hypothetical protein
MGRLLLKGLILPKFKCVSVAGREKSAGSSPKSQNGKSHVVSPLGISRDPNKTESPLNGENARKEVNPLGRAVRNELGVKE